MINFDEFAKVEMRVGLVIKAAAVEGSEKLIRMVVDFKNEKRVIFSGVRKWYSPEDMLNKKFIFVTNIEPRPMMGEESQGMIMAADSPEGGPIFLVPEKDAEAGSLVR